VVCTQGAPGAARRALQNPRARYRRARLAAVCRPVPAAAGAAARFFTAGAPGWLGHQPAGPAGAPLAGGAGAPPGAPCRIRAPAAGGRAG